MPKTNYLELFQWGGSIDYLSLFNNLKASNQPTGAQMNAQMQLRGDQLTASNTTQNSINGLTLQSNPQMSYNPQIGQLTSDGYNNAVMQQAMSGRGFGTGIGGGSDTSYGNNIGNSTGGGINSSLRGIENAPQSDDKSGMPMVDSYLGVANKAANMTTAAMGNVASTYTAWNNAAQLKTDSQKSGGKADAAFGGAVNAINSTGPIGKIVGGTLNLVNGVGGSLMNANATGKASDHFLKTGINSQVMASSSYGGVTDATGLAAQDAQAYRKAGLFGKLFSGPGKLQDEFKASQMQQSQTAGILKQSKQAFDGQAASADMYGNNLMQKNYNSKAWTSGQITTGKSGIKIKPSHEGRFTAYKERTGETTEEAKHSSSPKVRKMATFAQNAKKWKHQVGGKLGVPNPGPRIPHGGEGGSSATRPTSVIPQMMTQKIVNKGDITMNPNQGLALTSASKVNDSTPTTSLGAIAPFPIGPDIMSMVSSALNSSTSAPIDPSALPTMQTGGQLAVNNTKEMLPLSLPIIPPSTTEPTVKPTVPNPSAPVGPLANKSYPPLAPGDMQFWNGYVDYVKGKGLQGSPQLDVRSTNLSRNLFDEYAKASNANYNYADFIPRVQANIKQQRDQIILAARQGKTIIDGMIDRTAGSKLDIGDEQLNQKFMNGLSQIDGWAGSKTTTYRFNPVHDPKITGLVPGETSQDQEKYKKQVDFTKWGANVANGGIMQKDSVAIHKDGGAMNVIADGHLHAHLHGMEDLPLLEDTTITRKGIPVVTMDSGGNITQQAEIEGDELILHYNLTKQIEVLAKKGDEESMIEAGKLLARELVKNTKDSKSKILKHA